MKKIILLGAGGHCKVVIDALLAQKEYTIVGIIDAKKKNGEKILGFSVIGNDAEIKECFRRGIHNCFIAIGSIGKQGLGIRMRLYSAAKKIGFKFANIIHPGSTLSKFAAYGEGNYIAPGVIINAGTKIGSNCIINTQAVIEHDCTVADFVHIAPAACLGGCVKVGKAAHIGIGAKVIQGVSIGKNTVIGAGSVVLKDIADNTIAYGSPAHKRARNDAK